MISEIPLRMSRACLAFSALGDQVGATGKFPERAERGDEQARELRTSHTEIHTNQWTGNVIQVTSMGLGFGANYGVLEILGAGWRSRPRASGNRAEPLTTEPGSSKSSSIPYARVRIRCSLLVAAGAGSQQVSRQQRCHL